MTVTTDSQDRLLSDLPSINVDPLWNQMTTLVPPVPEPRAMAFKWSYETLRPYLIRAGKLVPPEQAERRVLMLTNPALKPGFTTDTLYAGLQLVQPGETAPAHRHIAFAIRLIIEGHGGFTAVEGKRIKMAKGDLILTPPWNWHDHGNDGEAEPMIWLDGLDLPQFQHFPIHFAQHYSEPRYPAKDVETSSILFPWTEMQARLDSSTTPHSIIRYTSQAPGEEGQDVSLRIGAQCERIEQDQATPSRRENASSIYHAIGGSGTSIIGDTAIDWVQGDTFAVPSWTPYVHKASSKSYLFRFDDIPMLRQLSFYRNEEDRFLALP